MDVFCLPGVAMVNHSNGGPLMTSFVEWQLLRVNILRADRMTLNTQFGIENSEFLNSGFVDSALVLLVLLSLLNLFSETGPERS